MSFGAAVTAYVTPRVSFFLYDTAGPYASLSASVTGGATVKPNGSVTTTGTGLVTGSVGMAAEVPIFGWTLGNITLATLDPPFFKATIWDETIGGDDPPSFGEDDDRRTVENQVYTVGTAIQPFSLPAATGGRPPLRYSVSGLPRGLDFDDDPDQRRLSGTPTQAVSNRTVTYQVRDANDDTDTLTFLITVNRPTPLSFGGQTIPNQTFPVNESITSIVLPEATGGRPFVCDAGTPQSCRPGLRYSLSGLPAGWAYDGVSRPVEGFAFDPETRTLSGKPVVAGEARLTYRVMDANNDTAEIGFQITVSGAPEPTPTGGKIYWTAEGTGTFYQAKLDGMIYRANLDGSGRETLISTGLSNPWGIAISGGKMYWTDPSVHANRIERANLDGSGRETLISTGRRHDHPWGIAISGGKMYWIRRYQHQYIIYRANLDGSGSETLISTGLYFPRVIAISGGKMYWTDSGSESAEPSIERANLDGSGSETLISTGLSLPLGIAISGGKMYWTDTGFHAGGRGRIERANLDGSGRETLISGLIARKIAISGGKMYWTEAHSHGNRIERANLDGSGRETLITGLRSPYGIAIVP